MTSSFAETVPGEAQQNAALAAGQSRAQQVQTYAGELNTEFGGTSLGAAYVKYMNANPSADPSATYSTVESRVYAFLQLGGSLGNAISGMFGAEGKALNQIATGTTSGLEGVSKDVSSLVPSWSLSVSGIAGWFFRGLKILFGGILMIIGISRLAGAENAVTRAAGKLPEMAVFA